MSIDAVPTPAAPPTPEPSDIARTGLTRRRFLAGSSAVVLGSAAAANLPATDARAAPVPQALPPWPDPVVLFSDDCSSMAAAGWAPRAVAAGAYAIDAAGTAANPYGITLPAVPAGQYLIHADEVSQPATTFAVLNRPVAIGAGAWQLDLRLRIDDIPRVWENAYTRGLMVVVNAGGQRFTFALVDRDNLRIGYGTSTNTHLRTVPVPFDGQFHDWTFRYDGVDTTMVAIDGSVVAVVRDVNVAIAGTEGITIQALALNWKSGQVHAQLDSVRLTARRTTTALGPGASLTAAGWSVDPARAEAYLTDNARSTGTVAGLPTVASGEARLHATDVVTGRHPAGLGSGSWTWRFLAKGTSLPVADSFGGRGLRLLVDAGGRRLEVSVVAGKLEVRKADGSWLTIPYAGAADGKFHRWTLGRDARGRQLVELDGSVVALADDLTTSTSEPDGVTVVGDGRGGNAAVTYDFSSFVLGRDTATAFHQPGIDAVSVLPASDATAMKVVVGVTGVDAADLASGALVLEATLVRHDDPSGAPLARVDQPIRTRFVPLSLAPQGKAEDLRLDLTVRRGAEGAATTSQRWLAPTGVTSVAAGGTAAPTAGGAVLFDQWDQCRTATGAPAAAAGWEPGSYTVDGTDLAGVFLDSTAAAQPLVVPVVLAGPCTVRLGFVSGTEAFDVTVGSLTRRITLPDVPAHTAANAYGPRVVGEVEVFSGDGAGQQLVITPVAGKQVRPAHLRVTGLTAAQASLAVQPAEGASGRRAIYNNDGYSDFFEGRYNSVADLQRNAVDVYQDSDVGALTWQAGTTFLLTYDSQWAGRPYAALTPAQEAVMRNGDKVAKAAILGLVDNGLVPLEVVAARCAAIGLKTYAGLRMNTFYQAAYAWLNGNLWDQYQDCLQTVYAGSASTTKMTYTATKFATYIRNVLVELAGFDGVDGLDLDFSRYPDVVGWEPAAMTAYRNAYGIDPRREDTPAGNLRWQQFRADMVTEVFRQLRAAVPDMPVIVRVPQANTLAYGLDVATWVLEGLIDVLVPTSISHEQFWSNIDEFAALVAGTSVRLYGGMTHTLAGGDLTKEEQDLAARGYATAIVRTSMSSQMYVERASAFYRAGYDGVYVFNNWRAAASLGLIGDKVATEQWRTFALPATWTRLGATAAAATAGSPADLAALLDSLLAAGALPRGQYERFSATVAQVRRAVDSRRGEVAASTLQRMVTQLRTAQADGEITAAAAAPLLAAAARVAGRL